MTALQRTLFATALGVIAGAACGVAWDTDQLVTLARHPAPVRCVIDSAGAAQIAGALMDAEMATRPAE